MIETNVRLCCDIDKRCFCFISFANAFANKEYAKANQHLAKLHILQGFD